MPELRERTDPLLARIRPRGAGLVVGAWDGEESLVHATGSLPAGEGTVFEIGSITKVFTSTLLVDMAADGLVALDDPVQRHLPEDVRIPTRERAITLED